MMICKFFVHPVRAWECKNSVKSEKFDESIDISVKLGVDPNKSDQNVRGAVTLPNSLGKEVKVAVFADGDHASQAEKAGADYIGMDDLAEKFQKEEINVDVVISSNAAMKVAAALVIPLCEGGVMNLPSLSIATNVRGGVMNLPLSCSIKPNSRKHHQ